MIYNEIKLIITPDNEDIRDVIIASLGEIGYDSFKEETDAIYAYVPKCEFDNNRLDHILKELPFDLEFNYTFTEIPDINWNEEWEKNYFQPIIIGDQCVVKSSFHKDVPDMPYTIIINPKMAFGTGHHQTTGLMIQEILKIDFTGQKVLDMGCGTAILAILASMRGAKDIVGIDIDSWAYDNAVENVTLNNITNIKIEIGGSELLGIQRFDTIIANINRNVLLADMNKYSEVLRPEGMLLMSGFYVEDIPLIEESANDNELRLEYYTEKDNWAGVKFSKL